MISEIFENQTLCISNVLYYRGWLTQQLSNEVFQKMEALLKGENANKNGAVITATNAIEMKNGEAVMDIEVFIPLDREIKVTKEYKFIPKFEIPTALKVRVEGNPSQFQTAMQMLSEYMQKNELQPATPALVATVRAAQTPLEIDEMITEIYVGVKNK